MRDNKYRFKLGDFECLAVLDNTYPATVDLLFSNISPDVTKPIMKKRGYPVKNIVLSGICLVINTGSDWVLLDTGIGDLQEGSKLRQILDEEEIRPDHIILTHAHLDHYGGLVDRDGNLCFPNAQIYMCRDEWAIFTSEAYLEENPDRAEVICKHLLPAETQMERVECRGEILPGFSILPLPGHTPHHIAIVIESNEQKLIFSGDVLPHPLHLEHLNWQFGFDSDPILGCDSRTRLAEVASESGALVLAYHFDFPGLGHIIEQGNGWKWQPLN